MTNIFVTWPSVIPVAFLLGVALAMDAFGISITHGFKEPNISLRRQIIIAFTFGFFQALMPCIGWGIVYGFSSIESFQYIFNQIVPSLALVILAFLGGKMIYNNLHGEEEEVKVSTKSFALLLLVEGIATSIDALSSGLAMNGYTVYHMLVSILIIAIVTFMFGFLGVYLGKNFGHKFGNRSELIGGIILVLLGVIIFVRGEIAVNAPQIIPNWLSWLF